MLQGIGEIREIIIDNDYRNQGLGGHILNTCLHSAKKIGYNKIYLKTTSKMEEAQKLFRKFNFKPITERNKGGAGQNSNSIPCYLILDSLEKLT